jgi:hypothetical protein
MLPAIRSPIAMEGSASKVIGVCDGLAINSAEMLYYCQNQHPSRHDSEGMGELLPSRADQTSSRLVSEISCTCLSYHVSCSALLPDTWRSSVAMASRRIWLSPKDMQEYFACKG